MKKLLLISLFILLVHARPYTFMIKTYDKEIELEAQILSQIAKNSLSQEIQLFIPNITKTEQRVYSKYFKLSSTCQSSNFVFVKKNLSLHEVCEKKNKLFFTNNYQRLLSNPSYYGAFFWSKSRPNIVFIKNRLEKSKIELPDTFLHYVEDF